MLPAHKETCLGQVNCSYEMESYHQEMMTNLVEVRSLRWYGPWVENHYTVIKKPIAHETWNRNGEVTFEVSFQQGECWKVNTRKIYQGRLPWVLGQSCHVSAELASSISSSCGIAWFIPRSFECYIYKKNKLGQKI